MISIPGKIPIRISPFFWLLIFMIGWLSSGSLVGTLIWAVVITISVLIHEYGHALTALAFGQQAEISLVGLGGLTRRVGGRLKSWQEFLIVLNGPVAGFLLFILAYRMQALLHPVFQGGRLLLLDYALEAAIFINLIWSILNLVPIQPLDGGQLLRIILEKFFGFRGIKVSFLISVILASFLCIFFFLEQQFLAGALFLMMAFEGYRAWAELKTMSPQDTNEHLQEMLKQAQEDLKAGRHNEAFSKLLYLREQTKEGVLFVLTTQYIARLLAEQGQFKQAYDWLLPIEYQLAPDYLFLLQQLAYRLQDWNQVVRIGSRAYREEPRVDIALLNALSYGIMGQVTPAVGWLRSAIQIGLPHASDVMNRREFDAIRDSAEFQALFRKQ